MGKWLAKKGKVHVGDGRNSCVVRLPFLCILVPTRMHIHLMPICAHRALNLHRRTSTWRNQLFYKAQVTLHHSCQKQNICTQFRWVGGVKMFARAPVRTLTHYNSIIPPNAGGGGGGPILGRLVLQIVLQLRYQ